MQPLERKHAKIPMLLVALSFLFSCSTNNTIMTSPMLPLHDSFIIRESIDTFMKSYDFHGRFSGTVLVAHKDTIWYENSFGYADIESSKQNTNGSVYGIGSVSKQFTASAILHLVQNGKLNLSDKLSSFFPDLCETGDKITIHHLLSMTSGIYEDFSRSKNYDISSVVFPESDPISSYDLVYYFGELSSFLKPGEKFDYSNINYIILAAIIEQLTGQNYGEYLREAFWQPAGMKSTVFGLNMVNTGLLSKPYVGLPIKHATPDSWHDSWMIGAGGVFSSAQDLYRWMYKVQNLEVLDPIHTDKLFKKHINDGREHYAYGWQIGVRKGYRYHYHGGGTLGYVCEAGFYPELDLYIVILTNHSHNLMEIGKSVQLVNEIGRGIENILFGEPYTALPVPVSKMAVNMDMNYLVGEFEYAINKSEEAIEIIAIGDSPSILDIAFSQNLSSGDASFKKAQDIAEAFGREDFKYIRKNAELTLRILVSTEKLQEIWTEITGDKGDFIGYSFYQTPNDQYKTSYKVRLVHKNKEIGLLLTFNKRGKMKGMHIDKSFSFGGPKTVSAIPINETLFFIDGFIHGYPDASIELIDDRWIFRSVKAEFVIQAIVE